MVHQAETARNALRAAVERYNAGVPKRSDCGEEFIIREEGGRLNLYIRHWVS